MRPFLAISHKKKPLFIPLCCHLKRVGLLVAIIFYVNFRPFSFFMRTTRAKINPGSKSRDEATFALIGQSSHSCKIPLI